MPIFAYNGRSKVKEKVSGTIEATDSGAVVALLKMRNITPINIKLVARGRKNTRSVREILVARKVTSQDVLNFARQMAILISAGIPIIRALKQLATSAKVREMAQTLSGIAAGVEAGKSLAVSLKAYPKVFPPLFVSLVEVGENTGKIEDAFNQLVKFLEVSAANRKRLIAAVRYPIIVIVAVVLVMVVMNMFVVPQFASMFAQFNAQLPLPTRILITTSNFMINDWPLVLFGMVIIGVSIKLLLRVLHN